MRYRGIELKEGPDKEAEILVELEFLSELEDEELEEMEDKISELFKDSKYNIYIDTVDETLIQIRCDEVTFDEKGIKIITYMYNTLKEAGFEIVKVAVHADEWFKDEDGTEYNEDSVLLEEFLYNLEYDDNKRKINKK